MPSIIIDGCAVTRTKWANSTVTRAAFSLLCVLVLNTSSIQFLWVCLFYFFYIVRVCFTQAPSHYGHGGHHWRAQYLSYPFIGWRCHSSTSHSSHLWYEWTNERVDIILSLRPIIPTFVDLSKPIEEAVQFIAQTQTQTRVYTHIVFLWFGRFQLALRDTFEPVIWDVVFGISPLTLIIRWASFFLSVMSVFQCATLQNWVSS